MKYSYCLAGLAAVLSVSAQDSVVFVTVDPDPTQIAISVEFPDPTEVVVTVDAPEPTDPTQIIVTVDAPEPTEIVVTVDPPEPTEIVVTVDPPEPTGVVVTVDEPEPTEVVVTVDPVEPTVTEDPNPVETGTPPPVEPAEPTVDDIKILNYALTLEYLEQEFYRQGLTNYSTGPAVARREFVDDGNFFDNLQEIYADESTHVSVLRSLLGDQAVEPCTYTFPSTDLESFVGLAAVLEGVGVAAYLGALSKITLEAYITSAAAIVTVEARHHAYLRGVLEELPFAIPFDTPLDFNQVYTLAASFIVSCPAVNDDKPQIAFKPFPALTLNPAFSNQIQAGDYVVFNTPGYVLVPRKSESNLLYAAFLTLNGPVFTTAYPTTTEAYGIGFIVQIPDDPLVNGQSYVVITQCDVSTLNDAQIAVGPAIIEITNIDTYGLFDGAESNPIVAPDV